MNFCYQSVNCIEMLVLSLFTVCDLSCSLTSYVRQKNQPNGSVHFDQQNISVLNKMSGKIRNLYVPSVCECRCNRIHIVSAHSFCFNVCEPMSACLSSTTQRIYCDDDDVDGGGNL